jgi:hypothetical protein
MARETAKTDRIDFGGVPKEKRARFRRIKEGTYKAKVVSHKKKWKDDDKSNPPYYAWTLQITEGKYKGTPFIENTSLKKDALFNLRNLIFACTDGKKNVAGKTVNFNPKNLYGKVIGIVVEDEEYDNKMRSKVVDMLPLSEVEEDEEGEEEAGDEADEDDDEDTDDDEDDEDEDEDEDEDDGELEEVDTEDI